MDINTVRIKWIKEQIKHLESIPSGKINRYGNFRGNQPSKESQEDIDYSLAWLKNELVGNMNINDLSYCEQGEYDALHGHPVRGVENPEYYWGYADQYAQEQCDTAKTETNAVGGTYEFI
tara:strand:+ start:131 stop:490 length:360 start_codon:yes stop_codon:yes gene_type:complete